MVSASTFGQISGRQLPARNASEIQDTIKIKSDTISKDSLDIPISPDAPDADVTYSSEDSSYLDAHEKMFYLFGNAVVKYQSYELKAARIRLDMDNDIAYAEGVPDSAGKIIGLPHFSDGEQEFDAKKMRYNFRTRKGIIDEAVTKYTDLFIRGTVTKFIGGDPKDTTQHDIIYNRNAIITSCNAEHPHFGIRSTKQKLIKDKMVVIGPSNLEIMGVPTPFWLPFGFFPVTNKRSSGLIIPRDYEYSQTLGFGLRNVGWYQPMGDHFDLSVQGDIYTRGSWGLQISSNYNKRYKRSGNFLLAFSNRLFENAETGKTDPNKSYAIQWRHSQAQQANPYHNFSASVNFQRNGFQRNNFNDARNVLNNNLSSNINYTRTFPGKPFTFSASINQSSNTQDSSITLSLPNINFQMQRIYPFKRKIKAGDEKWYEQISFNYNASVQSLIKAKENDFFTDNTLNSFVGTFGVKQVASTDLNLRVMKYFNLAPSINFREIWNMRSIRYDSLQLDEFGQKYDTLSGFKAAHLLDVAIGLNTAIYGTMKFKKGPLRGFRHTIRPNIALAYSPSSDPYLGAYRQRIISGRDTIYTRRFYSQFQGMTYDEISNQPTRLGISYGFTNIFEGKYFSKKDSVDKKFKLFDNVYVNGFYNFVADSFKWSPMTTGGATRLFGGLSTLSINSGLSFYDKDSLGFLNKTTRLKKGKFPVRFDQFNINLGTNFSFEDIKNLISKWKGQPVKKEEPVTTDEGDDTPKPKKKESPETFWQMFKGFGFSHNLSFGEIRDPLTNKTKNGIITNTISTQGSIDLTKNWKITIGNIGYDFKNKGLTYPDIGFSRILHCWQMTFSYQPDRGTYSFNIFASQGTFNFLKLPYRKDIYDPRDDL